MIRPRVIPILLIHQGGLCKTIGFDKPNYTGDPINTIKLFNDMEVDEILILDIDASKENRPPNFELIEEAVSEAFIPLGYGGGVRDLGTIQRLFRLGVEKVCLNSHLLDDMSLLKEAIQKFGSQSLVAAVDITKNWMGKYKLYDHRSGKTTDKDPAQHIQELNELPVGEIVLNSVQSDGRMNGYDLDLIKKFSGELQVPLIASGGAGEIEDLRLAIDSGADAAAAGSLFIYQNKQRGVLVNYPSPNELDALFKES